MERAPSPELRSQYKEQPIPGWQPYDTDPIVRRVDAHGTEYSVPFYDVLGRGQRYLNPHHEARDDLRNRHPNTFILKEVEAPKEPEFQRTTLEAGAKSIMDVLAWGFSGWDEDYRRYILEKADMESHRFLLKNCAGVENDVLACISEEGACADTYAELLTCGAIRLFPEVTQELAAATPDQTKTEEYVQRKNELIRNTVAAFLRRDRYYTTKQMDFYRRRVAHCALLDHMDWPSQDEWQGNAFYGYKDGIWIESETEFPPGQEFFIDEGDWREHGLNKGYAPGYEDDKHEHHWNTQGGAPAHMGQMKDTSDSDEIDEDFDLAMAKCVIPGICPKPLDEWVHCITAAEGIEAHCVRPYKKLLSCIYNFQFYAFGDEDPYSVDSPRSSIIEDPDDAEIDDIADEEDTYSEPNTSTDLGHHTGLFRTGLYRIFHQDPNTLPLDELEEDHRIMRRQISRLEHIRRRERGITTI